MMAPYDVTVLAESYRALKRIFSGLTEGPDNDWVIDLHEGKATASTADGECHVITSDGCPPVKARAVLRVRNGCGTLRHFSFTDRT